MRIEITFKYLKIVVARKVESRKRITEVQSQREETINIKSMVMIKNFTIQIMRPKFQTSMRLNFGNSM